MKSLKESLIGLKGICLMLLGHTGVRMFYRFPLQNNISWELLSCDSGSHKLPQNCQCYYSPEKDFKPSVGTSPLRALGMN